MKNERFNHLEQRIEHLEKSNKRFLLLLAAFLALAVFTFARPRQTQDVLAVQRLTLVDGKGEVHAELALRDGSPGLFLKDKTGKDRVVLIHDSDQSALFIKDETETTRIGVAQFSHGGGGFALHGPESKGAAVLYFKEKGSLRIFDRDGVVTDQVPAIKPK